MAELAQHEPRRGHEIEFIEVVMRTIVAAVFAVIAGVTINTAQAETNRWCVAYGGATAGQGVSKCYFKTLTQCRTAIAGQDGVCHPNELHNAAPAIIPEGAPIRKRS
jgi:Protein of unknown function (DUF3551)